MFFLRFKRKDGKAFCLSHMSHAFRDAASEVRRTFGKFLEVFPRWRFGRGVAACRTVATLGPVTPITTKRPHVANVGRCRRHSV
jgi:hypothetical protein